MGQSRAQSVSLPLLVWHLNPRCSRRWWPNIRPTIVLRFDISQDKEAPLNLLLLVCAVRHKLHDTWTTRGQAEKDSTTDEGLFRIWVAYWGSMSRRKAQYRDVPDQVEGANVTNHKQHVRDRNMGQISTCTRCAIDQMINYKDWKEVILSFFALGILLGSLNASPRRKDLSMRWNNAISMDFSLYSIFFASLIYILYTPSIPLHLVWTHTIFDPAGRKEFIWGLSPVPSDDINCRAHIFPERSEGKYGPEDWCIQLEWPVNIEFVKCQTVMWHVGPNLKAGNHQMIYKGTATHFSGTKITGY